MALADSLTRCLLSAGIDVGTATTKIIISRLCFAEAGGAIPRLLPVSRSIICRSRLQETPVQGDRLDGTRLLHLIEEAYVQAGITPDQIESGGIIITGEAARKENARELTALLARRAGQFVVATAGPHLEAILAGRGSGAAARSETSGAPVAAVDVGGGTANIALFRAGRVVDTAVVNLGGEAVQFAPGTGCVSRISPQARAAGIHLSVGEEAGLPQVAAVLAGGIVRALPGPPLEVWVSGGVGNWVGSPDFPADALHYGDIGPALGWALGLALREHGYTLRRPVETTFATVIGVGVHTLQVSGATIRIPDPAVLPLTNVPVIRPPDLAPETIRKHASWVAADGPVALAVGRLPDLSFKSLQAVAGAIAAGLGTRPLVVVAEQDIAAALGLLLNAGGAPGVITVDEIALTDGNYLDIGLPLFGGAVVPVIVKTLVFAAEGEECE